MATGRKIHWVSLVVAWAALAACATEAPPSPPKPIVAAPRRSPAVRAPDAGSDASPAPPAAAAPARALPALVAKQLSEEEWRAQVREKVTARWRVAASELRFSPGQTLLAFIQAPPLPAAQRPKQVAPKPHTIVVVDNEGRLQRRLGPVQAPRQHTPPKDLQFLGDDRLVYEVALPTPPPAAVGVPPAPPRRLFVIQPLTRRRGRPIRCEGVHFVLSTGKTHLAFVAGKAGEEFVAIDGSRAYPRGRGRTSIASAPAWSKDGVALAFVEARLPDPPRLVLLADVSNPTGDTVWDLPPSTALDGLQVFWAGAHKLVVGKSLGRPVFATTFEVER